MNRVDQCIIILRHSGPMTVEEYAAQANIPMSTANAVLGRMYSRGILIRDDVGRFHLKGSTA